MIGIIIGIVAIYFIVLLSIWALEDDSEEIGKVK